MSFMYRPSPARRLSCIGPWFCPTASYRAVSARLASVGPLISFICSFVCMACGWMLRGNFSEPSTPVPLPWPANWPRAAQSDGRKPIFDVVVEHWTLLHTGELQPRSLYVRRSQVDRSLIVPTPALNISRHCRRSLYQVIGYWLPWTTLHKSLRLIL